MKTPGVKNTNKSLAFWAWNGNLQEAELFEQMESLKKGGYGGFFMHSREGLETVYLSEEWLTLCEDCAREGYQKGMLPFLYDEDKWPSGMAGGLVSKLFPDCAAKALVYIGETDEIEVRTSKGHPWYSGYAPANNLSEKSVRKFIEITHEKYAEHFGGRLEGKVEGFFTDEPNFWDFFFTMDEQRPALPYTDDLYEQFRLRRGYELNPRLLFFKEDGYRKHRHDYWRTLSELFCERYTKQLCDWCDGQGVKLCGHLLFENELGYQTRVCGAAMPNYQYMHIPGIDILGEQTREYLTVKQCTSVAHQYGKEAAISESYGCTGWDFTFEGQKRLWDFQCALGITIRSQHLSFYSIKGLRKRDYPPAFSYQSEWYRYNHVIEDYCARLSGVMSEGKPLRELLVIHPISGTWCESGSTPTEDLQAGYDDNMGWTCENILELNAQGDELNLFAEALLKNGLDFDFGDEQMMARDGAVDRARLRIAQAEYSVVILPRTASIFASTRDLLRQFAEAGGTLIAVEPLPAMIEGEAREFGIAGAVLVGSYEEAIEAAKACIRTPAEITDIHTGKTADVIAVYRGCADGEILVAVNEDFARECRITLNGDYCVSEYDLQTGERREIEVGYENEFYAKFERSDCRVYLLARGAAKRADVRRPYAHPHCSEDVIAALGPVAEFERTMPNALTLDFCEYCFEGEEYSPLMQVWQAQRAIRERMGFRQIVGNGVDMRYTWIHEQKPTARVRLRFRFTIKDLPAEPAYVCVEEAQRFQIACNGAPCGETGGWFVDKAIKKVRLANVKQGENIIELRCKYSHDMEIEDIYIAGAFGVSPEREIIAEPEVLHMGDITLQGYLHYPGSMIYKFKARSEYPRGTLVLGEHRATLVAVRVNGRHAGNIMIGNSLDIPLNVGENDVEIEAVGSNRNLMGPFHHTYDGCKRVGWKDFRMEEGEHYTPAYIVKPYGLLSQIKIVRK